MSLSSFIADAKEAGFKDEEEAAHHILLFVSALIPKAIASMLTSFFIATSGPDKVRIMVHIDSVNVDLILKSPVSFEVTNLMNSVIAMPCHS